MTDIDSVRIAQLLRSYLSNIPHKNISSAWRSCEHCVVVAVDGTLTRVPRVSGILHGLLSSEQIQLSKRKQRLSTATEIALCEKTFSCTNVGCSDHITVVARLHLTPCRSGKTVHMEVAFDVNCTEAAHECSESSRAVQYVCDNCSRSQPARSAHIPAVHRFNYLSVKVTCHKAWHLVHLPIQYDYQREERWFDCGYPLDSNQGNTRPCPMRYILIKRPPEHFAERSGCDLQWQNSPSQPHPPTLPLHSAAGSDCHQLSAEVEPQCNRLSCRQTKQVLQARSRSTAVCFWKRNGSEHSCTRKRVSHTDNAQCLEAISSVCQKQMGPFRCVKFGLQSPTPWRNMYPQLHSFVLHMRIPNRLESINNIRLVNRRNCWQSEVSVRLSAWEWMCEWMYCTELMELSTTNWRQRILFLKIFWSV